MADDIPQAHQRAYEKIRSYLEGEASLDDALVAMRVLEPTDTIEEGDEDDLDPLDHLGIEPELLGPEQRARFTALVEAMEQADLEHP